MTGAVHELAVAGPGPRQLLSPGPVPEGTVIGRMTESRTQPVANVTFDVCVGDCADGLPVFTFSTDASGRFEAKRVKVIEYWAITDRRSGSPVRRALGHFFVVGRRAARQLECCWKLRAGKTLDLGTFYTPLTP